MLALQWFGPRLGGAESERWIGILQALLCGWIVYVAAVGMTVGAVLEFAPPLVGDLIVGMASILMCLWSMGAVIPVFVTGHLAYHPILFHLIVMLLLVWTAIRWFWLANWFPKG